jgi:geranylgeranyl reductase family protein
VHDVAIVGAGPGGSATAHFLATRGVDVLLLDRAEFPRDKTCGDGLTPRALRVLETMGILPEVLRHGCAIDSYEVVAPNGKRTRADTKGLVVPRLELDDIILRRAISSGAQFRGGVTVERVEADTGGVTIATRHEGITAKRAVVATGAATGVLTRSGILRQQPRAMLAARAYFEGVPSGSSFELYFGGVPQPGYGWVFPIEGGVVNAGVGYLPKHTNVATRGVFEPWVQARWPAARAVGEMRGYPIRVDFLSAPTFAQRTLLVGEAAGLVNPLTGEGIDYALESGQIAAEHLLQEPFRPAAYHAQLHARFQKIFRFSENVRDWYCKPPLLNVLVPLANRYPELRQLLASIVLGEREPAGFGPLETLARLLLYLIRRPHWRHA